MDTQDKLLTVKEAAELLGVNHRTLNNWRSRGIGLPYYKISNRSIRYTERDCITFRDARKITPVNN